MARRQGDVIVLSAIDEDILTVLYNAQWIYGLKILELINDANKQVGRRKMSVGSLYPALQRLQQEGLIQGRWADESVSSEESQGARRRYYTISGTGQQALENTLLYRQILNPSLNMA